MKEQLFIVFLTHLLKQHENEVLTLELNDRLSQAAIIQVEHAVKTYSKKPKSKNHTGLKPLKDKIDYNPKGNGWGPGPGESKNDITGLQG